MMYPFLLFAANGIPKKLPPTLVQEPLGITPSLQPDVDPHMLPSDVEALNQFISSSLPTSLAGLPTTLQDTDTPLPLQGPDPSALPSPVVCLSQAFCTAAKTDATINQPAACPSSAPAAVTCTTFVVASDATVRVLPFIRVRLLRLLRSLL